MRPIYDIKKSYLENAEEGPYFNEPLPTREFSDERQWQDFLGFKIASPLGVPAGPLLNSKWTTLAAGLGFDVVTYKTIRSHEHPGHGLPNVIFIEGKEQLDPEHLPNEMRPAKKEPSQEFLAITNSFGMPSRSRDYIAKDIARGNRNLKRGQVMPVSVVGTPKPQGSFMEFVLDFVDVAVFAKECGAKIIEANFSCPNVCTREGSIYTDPKSAYTIAKELVKALQGTPLIVKLGLFPNESLMKETLVACAKAGVQAICGINTISMKIVDEAGSSPLGPDRKTSGICGNPIRNAALSFIRKARACLDKEKLGMVLMSSGGITLPEHFNLFLSAGAEVVTCATGMMWNPFLAMEYHKELMLK